jgi:hypothetical protein
LNIRRVAERYLWIRKVPDWVFRPLLFINTTFYGESDYYSDKPRYKPTVSVFGFKLKVARCYDTRYQKNILNKRPVIEYENWGLEHYEKPRSLVLKVFDGMKYKLIKQN